MVCHLGAALGIAKDVVQKVRLQTTEEPHWKGNRMLLYRAYIFRILFRFIFYRRFCTKWMATISFCSVIDCWL